MNQRRIDALARDLFIHVGAMLEAEQEFDAGTIGNVSVRVQDAFREAVEDTACGLSEPSPSLACALESLDRVSARLLEACRTLKEVRS